jgi:hypothetical protein
MALLALKTMRRREAGEQKMDECGEHNGARDVWSDHERRQEFEHELIDRKTTWLLTTQAILFAAYGVTFDSGITVDQDPSDFRTAVSRAGLAIAVIVLIGVVALINSKRIAWRRYRSYFASPDHPNAVPLPKPRDSRGLQWGVWTPNTIVALLPDVMLPIVFIVAWLWLAPLS